MFAELGEVINGSKPAHSERTTVFKSLGKTPGYFCLCSVRSVAVPPHFSGVGASNLVLNVLEIYGHNIVMHPIHHYEFRIYAFPLLWNFWYLTSVSIVFL